MSDCTINGCDRPAVLLENTVCRPHYLRKWRGNESDAPIRAVRPAKGVCVVEFCESEDSGPHGYCLKHMTRVRRHGDPLTVIQSDDRNLVRGERSDRWTGDRATYSAMHLRVRKARGPAKQHTCVDCGGTAHQWSYDRTDPDERTSPMGPYSTRVEHYAARCVPCHKRFDLRALGRAL